MAFGKQKNSNQQYNLAYYKKKRNIFLFFAFLPLIIFIGMWVLLGVLLDIRSDILLSISLPLIIGYTFYLYILRDKISYFTMYYEYHYMMDHQIGPIKTHGALFTPSWLTAFDNDGFVKLANTNDFLIYQQFHHKLKDIANSGYTVVNIVVAKHEDVDFYDPKIDSIIQQSFEAYKYKQRVKRSITIQFKRYPELTEQIRDEIMKVINFKHYQQHIVNITVGYFHEDKKVYFLCPKHRYPNRYYFYACKQIMKYSKIKEEDIDAKRTK